MKCKNCSKEFKPMRESNVFCCKSCRVSYNSMVKQKEKFKGIDDIPVCKICGWPSTALHSHISQTHKITIREYKDKYNLSKEDIYHSSYLKNLSDKCKGDKNPAFNHGGRLSPFSKKFIKYENLSNEEKEHKIKECVKTARQSTFDNNNITSTLEYWLKMTEGDVEKAKKLLKERQSTFSKDICIEKYGEEEGVKVWQERQDKWQNTLKSKSPEEIDRINKKKCPGTFRTKSYSKISQKLFWSIHKIIKDDFKEIHFATTINNGKNNEYIVNRFDGRKALLDFYIKDNNKVIEFDGDYWHGVKKGNQERDAIREKMILKENSNFDTFHVKECDYNNDKGKTIKDCLNFIYG